MSYWSLCKLEALSPCNWIKAAPSVQSRTYRRVNSLEILGLTLQWRHSEPDGVSNHKRLDCLLNRLFWCRSKKTSTLNKTIKICYGKCFIMSPFALCIPYIIHLLVHRRRVLYHVQCVAIWYQTPRHVPFLPQGGGINFPWAWLHSLQ